MRRPSECTEERRSAGGGGMIGRELGDIVLSWTLEDILDDNLFADKVNLIPGSFQSLKVYLESYIPPLLEETRVELSSCFESISEAPSYKIQCIEAAKSSEIYYVDVDCSSNESSGTNSDYKPRNGDIYILSSIKPEAVDDFRRYGVNFCMVLVSEVTVDDAFLRGFRVKASKHIDKEEDLTGYHNAIFLTNIITNTRIWRSLHFNTEMNSNFSVIESVLSPACSGNMTCNVCSLERDCWFLKLPEEIVSIDLNESQIQAVKSAVSTLSCRHSHFVKLIWGPPGTGKTKTVCAILWAFMHMKCRILTCAPTNIAVTSVCSRLICLVKEFHDNNNMVDSSFSSADIVLFGSKDRMNIDDELQVVFLEHRVEQLVDCFSLMSGWKYRISAMIDFLQDCALQYESYLETGSGEDGEILFLDFIRKQFNLVASPLEACLKNLCIHLPRSCLSKADATTILGVIGLVENLHRLIFKDDASNDEMQAIFFCGYRNAESSIVQDDFITFELGLSARMQLEEARSDCLKLLKSLKNTLSLPYGVSENWIKRFCLGNASIIFCTASSAFLLHFVEMDPLDMLIVDEAAQLRESEIIIPLRLNGIKHAILVGDEIQLRSLVKSQVCKFAGFGLSLFERLVSFGHPKDLLKIQYRMHPSISLFPNVNFYGKQILDGLNVQDFEYGKHCSGLLFGSYAFINITDGREELDDIGGSHKNMVEVAVVLHLITSIFKSWKVNGGSLSIGVIAPYSSQVKAIKEKLGNTYDTDSGFGVRVNSVDGFQGGEEDIIILSTVRCNTKGSIGFLGDIQRMNVALTRARHCLWILGNAETLLRSGTKWEELVHDAKKRRCFFQASEMEGLARLMLHVKCELDQLDDLFNSNSFLNSSMWKVLFSANFRKSFAKLKSLQMKKKVIQTILRLASGWRSKRNDATLSDSFQLAKIYRMGEHYLVWTIDIVMDERYIQVIKIWDILLLSQLMSFISRIDRIFSMYTDSYISRCKEKCTDGIEVPVSWNSNQNILQYKKHCELELAVNAKLGQIDGEDVLENSKVSESLLLMKFYALTSGIVSHLLTANDGTELNIPFELTDEEKHVVRFSRSSFILGRSGTGKTTILTTKLVQKQQQHTLALQGVCVLEGDLSRDAFRNDSAFENDERLQKKKMLKQVFITVSPKLCLAIQDHINRLTSFAASGCLYGPSNIEMRDTSDLLAQFVDIPDTFHDLPNKHFPLVVTFSKFLMMLDGSMSRSFFSKFRNDQDLSINGSNASKSLALQMFFQKEVDFEKFVGSYWPHFSTQLTKKLDACSVYTEIISHIKGDLEAGSFLDGKLGRRDYIMLANKRVSPFCEDMRGDIFDIFLDYEKKKCLNGEFDIADFVIDLHQRLRCSAHLGDKFDYVYVDEVQDLTMRQVALLKYCCTNYDEGFVFAGDTAQTIARGVDFRFEDIRCLFYKEFTSELRIEDHGLKKGERIKDNFQLNQNFRTHSGVLKLAKSIMDLLFNFFPLSIDRIAPEISLIYGESPVLLKSTNDENAIITIFGSGTGECSNMIEFGAEQVILVRDDIAKSQIVDLVGTKALVLTIIECKGLEFQDVLLYNFFGGSPLKNKWRVVYEYMNENGFADQSGMTACPNFDHGRHGLLCSELKQLYVAITRTRQRLWISENSYDFCKPIFDYWKSLCLVQVRHLDSSLAQAMQAISTSDDWRVRGIKLFNEENFEMATMCFERAGDIYREKWARAAGLVSSADSILSSKPEMAKAVLSKAADIYESIGKPESAATCYIKLKDFNSAGRLYLEKCGEASLEAAGDCFSMAEKLLLAADVYAKAKCFSKCLSMCSQGELFDAGLRFIKQWKDDSDFDKLKQHELCKVEKSFLESCVMHYVTLRDITHMVELAKVLQSMDLIRNSLKSRGLLDELLELEMVMGNYIEAADLAHVKGNILLEADMLQKAGHFEKSAGVILLHVIVNSLWAPGSKGWPLKKFAKKEEFLDKAKVIAKQVSDSFYDIVSSEAYLLSDCSKDLLYLSRHLVKAHKFQNIRLEIFTLREIIDIHLQFEPCKYVWEPGLVSDVDKHTHLIMSQNICSVESLMHTWKLWKNKILKVLSHLSSSTQFKENDFELYEQFCFEYLGILMNSDQNTFFLLNPEASWTNSCKNSPKLRDLP
ncbi:hypothetical protein KSP39_PZI004917 [Platanthera zijinensis]|uniref:UvrD-like helicase ATP-binding domain-containing protein n=1 Tax=Platanthera zijinensis TaxID=2320716 RepID=A0AAP0GCA4_9ASPA